MSLFLSEIPSEELCPVMDYLTGKTVPVIFDLSENNEELGKLDLNNEAVFTDFIFGTLRKNKAEFGIGKYGEERVIYKRSEVFGTSRSVHLGIDLWAAAGSIIYAPLNGRIHSFADNNNHGDYGPTIIVAHEWKGHTFHTLYGHLSRQSIRDIAEGDIISKGEELGTLGTYEENVHWPPHLHFQVILDMEGKKGDYPGVCSKNEKDRYFKNCPDPNGLLRINALK